MAEPPSVLEAEIKRLHTAVYHLERSNQELVKAMEEEGLDPEYKQAIGENIVVLAKYK